MSELKINNVSVLTESGGEVTGTLKTLKMGATTVFTESGGTVTAQNMGFSANDAGIKTALNASGDAPIYACRAWVNFNGTNVVATDSTPAITTTASPNPIRDHGNVSSVVDISGSDGGIYTINFNINMPHVNYCALATHGDATLITNKSAAMFFDYQLDSISVSFEDVDAGGFDVEMANIAIFC